MNVRRIVAVSLLAATVAGCSFGNADDPYRGLPAPPVATDVVEAINLADLGLASYPCDLFDAPISRCYRPEQWLGVRQGREILGYIHRELTEAGARYWGGSASPTRSGAPLVVSGIEIGCFFDYQTDDYTLRVAVIGPSGEGEPCVNGLPGDGVSEVWIVGATFSAEAQYGGVVMPSGMEYLLETLPREPKRPHDIFGGPDATADGYYGPPLPLHTGEPGVHILTSTVAVAGGYVRGLVQYGGVAPTPLPPTAGPSPSPSSAVLQQSTGAVKVVIEVGLSRYEVPGVIRPGESVPFELALPAGFDATDLRVVPSWERTEIDWMGGQRLEGPVSNAACGTGAGAGGADIAELVPGAGVCLTFLAQATTGNSFITVDAVVATFAADGTVTEVASPYLIRDNRSEPGFGTMTTNSPDLALAWLWTPGAEPATGVWIHYAKQADITAEN